MKSKNELRKEIKKKVQTLSILERRNMGNIALSKLEMNKLFQNAQTSLSFW